APIRMSVDAGDGSDQPTSTATGQFISGNYFSVLGVPAAIGRTILPDDDRPSATLAVAVLAPGYWLRRFGGGPAGGGRTVRLNGYPVRVVGVSAPEFFGTHVGEAVDVSVPISLQPSVDPGFGASLISGIGAEDFWLELMGRLRAGTSPAVAQAELDALFQ